MCPEKEVPLPGPYAPTLILHGGAGNITRENLPPDLYAQYESSLQTYFDSTRQWLYSGASAVDAAVHAVSLMEDDPLFNCGRGSVFTEKGTIEMEASVMVASVDPDRGGRDENSMAAEQKRGASVSLVRNTRHPIILAREVLLEKPNGQASSMHCQLSGPNAEEWGWKQRRLERKGDAWFWTKRRWAEHLRGLQKDGVGEGSRADSALDQDDSNMGLGDEKERFLPSQGTVGAVCMDSWGDIAVATSTGGLTNKKVGRIGDTPTLGAGFWAESWEEQVEHPDPASEARCAVVDVKPKTITVGDRLSRAVDAGFGDLFHGCLPHGSGADEQDDGLFSLALEALSKDRLPIANVIEEQPRSRPAPTMPFKKAPVASKPGTTHRRRAVAVSGTGNGDTFLRTAACHTTAAICRYATQGRNAQPISLATAVHMTAGSDGQLQKSAGDRWKVTGEGQAGMIGIEVWSDLNDFGDKTKTHYAAKQPRPTGRIVFGFNCGGLWRAWMDEKTGKGRVMVFRDNYY